MKIAVTYSSKEGLREEAKKRFVEESDDEDIPPDLTAEGDDSETILAVINSLKKYGHQVVGLEADDELIYYLQEVKPDLVFNIAEGLIGDWRESYVPLICERLNIPYTGSGPTTLAICLNKARCKEILSYYKIPTPPFKVYHNIEEIGSLGFAFPAIVKPVAEGSSKGIFNNSVVTNESELFKIVKEVIQKYRQPAIVEKFLFGEEFTVAAFSNGEEIEILPIIKMDYSELPPEAFPFYSFEAKWVWDKPERPLKIFECPAKIDKELEKKIHSVVKRVYRVLEIRDWGRIDIRLDENQEPNILEVNPLPGILPNPEDNSCFPKAARSAGYSYEAMINRVVELAIKRYGLDR